MTKKRQTASKEAIKRAFTQLLQESDFETISVSKLFQYAGINRGTFYLHYEDKYDMAEKMKEDMMQELYTILDKQLTVRDLLIRNFHYLKTNSDFIRAVYRCNFLVFRESARDFILTIFQTDKPNRSNHFLEKNSAIPEEYLQEIFLSSVEGVMTLWVASGTKESPEQLADIILKIYNDEI